MSASTETSRRVLRSLLPGVLLMSLSLSGCVEYRQQLDFSGEEPIRHAVIDNGAGSVSIEGASRMGWAANVRMHSLGIFVSSYDSAFEVFDVDHEVIGDTLYLSVDSAGAAWADLTLSLPAELETVTAHTGLGGLTADRLELTTLSLESGSGAIAIDSITGDTQLMTRNGAIRVESLIGPLDATTTNGELRVRDVVGDCQLSTSNGLLSLRDVDGDAVLDGDGAPVEVLDHEGSLWLAGARGAVSVEVDLPPEGTLSIETSLGAIDVAFLSAPQGSLLAETSNAELLVDDLLGFEGDTQGRRAEGTVGGGGDQVIELRTSNGALQVALDPGVDPVDPQDPDAPPPEDQTGEQSEEQADARLGAPAELP